MNANPFGLEMATSKFSTRAILVLARYLISDPERWSRIGNVDENGKLVEYNSPNARRWSAYWALFKVVPYELLEETSLARTNAINLLHNIILEQYNTTCVLSISGFNREHSHEEVVGLFDKAIAISPTVV